MRSWLLLSVCLCLAACDRPVVSRKPLFPPSPGGPTMRPGVWLYQPEGNCKVDPAEPTANWPDCADWTLIAQGRIVGMDWPRTFARHKRSETSRPFDLEPGDPVILQQPSETHPGRTAYRALKVLRTDDKGQIVEAKVADLACPPPPEPGAAAPPLPPGLQGTRNLCYAADVETVRRVAREKLAENSGRDLRWIRDGDH